MNDPTVLLRVMLSPDHLPTDKTRHYLGGTLAPVPKELRIVKYSDDNGYYLFYCHDNGVEFTDTYHETLEKAMLQAEWEFQIRPHEWERATDLSENETAFNDSHLDT
jgi:hypothetical protein